MRQEIRDIVEIFQEENNVKGKIIEIGSYLVEGQDQLANLRNIFPDNEFIGCDMRKGRGVDRIEDIEQMTFEDDVADLVLSLDTLEHVKHPHKACNELYRITKPCGYCIISSVMDFMIHSHPYDYWRFTPYAFQLLLEQFQSREVFYIGNPVCPAAVVGIGKKDTSKIETDSLIKAFEQKNNKFLVRFDGSVKDLQATFISSNLMPQTAKILAFPKIGFYSNGGDTKIKIISDDNDAELILSFDIYLTDNPVHPEGHVESTNFNLKLQKGVNFFILRKINTGDYFYYHIVDQNNKYEPTYVYRNDKIILNKNDKLTCNFVLWTLDIKKVNDVFYIDRII